MNDGLIGFPFFGCLRNTHLERSIVFTLNAVVSRSRLCSDRQDNALGK